MADEVTPSLTEIEYRGAALDVDQLKREIDACFDEAGDGRGEFARLAGEDLDRLHESITLRWAGAGFQAQDVVLVVALVNPAMNHLLTSLWDEVILPRLRRRLGDDAVGREVKRTKRQRRS